MKKNAGRKATRGAPASALLPPSRPHPLLHEGWVRALVVLGLRNDAIRHACLDDDLPPPADEVIDAIRAALKPPKGFRPTSTTHAASLKYVEKLGVAPFIRRTPEAEEALALLRNARARELVECAALVGVPDHAVLSMLASHIGITARSEVLDLYCQTFFNVKAVGRAALRAIVGRHVHLAVQRVVGEDERALRRAVATDPRMVAVTLARSEPGWSAVCLALGIGPTRPELGKALGHLEAIATARVAEALLRAGRDDDRRAQRFAEVLGRVHEIKESVAAPSEDVALKLTKLVLRTDPKPVKTVAQLLANGGQVTVDVAPLSDPQQGDDGAKDDEDVEHAAVG